MDRRTLGWAAIGKTASIHDGFRDWVPDATYQLFSYNEKFARLHYVKLK